MGLITLEIFLVTKTVLQTGYTKTTQDCLACGPGQRGQESVQKLGGKQAIV